MLACSKGMTINDPGQRKFSKLFFVPDVSRDIHRFFFFFLGGGGFLHFIDQAAVPPPLDH